MRSACNNRSAMNAGPVDHVLPIGEIGPMIDALVRERAPRHNRANGSAVQRAVHVEDRPGHVSVFTCPECSGSLWESEETGVLRIRCRVSHVYSPDSMVAAQTDAVDRALWTALRALEERAALNRKLARHPAGASVGRVGLRGACGRDRGAGCARQAACCSTAAPLTFRPTTPPRAPVTMTTSGRRRPRPAAHSSLYSTDAAVPTGRADQNSGCD